MMGFLIWLYSFIFLFPLHNAQIATSSNFSSLSPPVPSLCPRDQSLALLQYKSMFRIYPYGSLYCDQFYGTHSYPKTDSWMESTDCCSWDGVTCDRITGHVIGLDLSSSQLIGPIPPNNSLFALPRLRRLNLACNNLVMPLTPYDFGQSSSLTHLNLSNSFFAGPLPLEISHLSKLVSLDLSNNDLLIGTPVLQRLMQNLTQLKLLALDNIDMSSVELASLTNVSSSLTHLSLSLCQLQGEFPSNILLLENLESVNLPGNPSLSGKLPRSNWNSSLRYLSLSNTGFSGELPSSVCGLTSLQVLSLNDCNFKGPLPSCLGNLTRITSLRLAVNNFSGHIPPSFSNLEELIDLYLENNQFTGLIPDAFGNMTRLSYIHFSNNQLEGPVPSSLSGLANLSYLKFSFNQLNGTVPSQLFSLPSLVFLALNNNKLTGNIGEFQSNSLDHIDLSHNEFGGPIPMSISTCINLISFRLNSNKLTGALNFSMFSQLQNLEELDLSDNNLSISSNSKDNFTLPSLVSLGLSSCNITGFPDLLRAVVNPSDISLSGCNIHGRFPEWAFNLWNNSLKSLNLSHNFLTSIDLLPARSLSSIDLHSNLLQGPVPVPSVGISFYSVAYNNLYGGIPSLFCNQTLSGILDLSYNHLTGTIPRCFGNLRNVMVLNLQMNSFHGTIPSIFGNWSRLVNLDLNGNQLKGHVPPSLVHCESLQVLDLGNNKLSDTFPHWLSTLPQLQVLILRSNKFHGTVSHPKNNFSFTKLRVMDLSLNEFTGPLPTTYLRNLKALMNMNESKLKYMGYQYYAYTVSVTVKGLEIDVRITTIFTIIDLSSNKFQGHIPKVIGKLNSLRLLNLSHNSLSGHMPSSLANVTALESLDLSSNRLVGKIPAELASLTFLAKLNLSQNQLVGPIPQGNQFGTFSNDSFGGNLGLCGSPLSKKCKTEAEAPQPTIQQEDDSDVLSGFNWKVVSMGYGCGTVFGMVGGYLVFSTGKPQWLVRLVLGERKRKGTRFNQKPALRRRS